MTSEETIKQGDDYSQSTMVKTDGGTLASLDDLKTILYEFNAKPDTEARLLGDKKYVELSDIRQLNERILAKLNNHDHIVTSSITFIMSGSKIKDYSTWAEFERENWDAVNSSVQSLTIRWDMRIKLPQFKNPQRHELSCRIGRALAPKDVFQLVMTADDITEIMEAQSPCICKVDFINDVLANELLNQVEEWHKGLSAIPARLTTSFLSKRGKTASEILRYILPIAFLLIAREYYELYSPILYPANNDDTRSLIDLGIIFTSAFVIGAYFGRKLERSIDSRIDRLEQYPAFSISKGDKKAAGEYQEKNRSLSSQIYGRIALTLFGLTITSIAKACWGVVVGS